MFFAPRIVIQLYNTHQRNAQFYKLMFNFWHLLHVSHIVGSSSGRHACSVMCFIHIGVSSMVGLEHTPLPTRLLTPKHVKRTIVHIQLC